MTRRARGNKTAKLTKAVKAPPATKQKGPRFRFIREVIAELKKVVWLSRREAAYLTALVLIVSVAAGLILGAFDWSFARLVSEFLVGG
ncbi:preprotein translocase subunit SecE [Chloroflexota bacterium]